MPRFDSKYCVACPYNNQAHLPPEWKQGRDNVPLEVEDNQSNILLVFQAPGEAEWEAGKPLQPTRRQGGTAGRRVEQSWERQGKECTSFNITNAVQCFPGKGDDGRDLAPDPRAEKACSGWLREALLAGRYQKVIAFGKVAAEVVDHVVTREGLGCEVKYAPHPTGGAERDELDELWR